MNKKALTKFLKKSFICSLSFLSLFALTNCNEGPSNAYIEDAIAIVYQDEKPYLINLKEETYSLEYYDEIVELFNDYIAVKKDGKYGFIDRTGELVVPTLYDKVYPMYEEKAVVILDGNYQIIDNSGNTLYTFTDNIISESYFSEDMLIVTNGEKYGYLKYDKDLKTFSLSNLDYITASAFKNGLGIIGNYKTEIIYKFDEAGNVTSEIEEIKVTDQIIYNYIDKEFNLLFDSEQEKYQFDYADYFYNGYAVVGYTDTLSIPSVGQGGSSTKTTCLVYKYIDEYGNTLHFNHQYRYSVTVNGENTVVNKTFKDEVYLPFVQSFKSELAFVAKYRYSTIKTPLKQYMLVDTLGRMEFTDAIYGKTGYLFGYDSDPDFQSQSPGLFTVDEIIKINDTYAFKAGMTLTAPSWKVYFIKYDTMQRKYAFSTAVWQHFETKLNEDGTTTEILPEWAIQYKYKYLKNTSSNVSLKYAIENPYEMTSLGYSQYISDEYLVNSIRISRSDKYGLVKYEESTYYDEANYDYSNTITASFILEPIYDKIIY